ncbi:hypothetical protein JVU11DRAFT_1318 [Chiua virens]|nr:hypothetical protein JVU11DRAFT_1318 [Chiua virens]
MNTRTATASSLASVIRFFAPWRRSGELTDLDMSVNLTELGNQVVTRLSDVTLEEIGAHSEVLREQTERMAATEDLQERMELMSTVETLRERMELGSAPGKLREQIELMSAADRALQAIIEQDPSPRNPEVQRPIDEWNEEAGSPVECKRQLGVLLSFLGGEGEVKMREVLERLDFEWPYKDHKIAATTQTLQGYMPYFYSVLASRLRCLMEGWA